MTDTLSTTITPLPNQHRGSGEDPFAEPLASTNSSDISDPSDDLVVDLRSDDPAEHHASSAWAQPSRANDPLNPKGGGRRPKRKSPNKTHRHTSGSERRQRIRPRRYERLEDVFAWAETEGATIDTDALLLIVETEADFETWPPDCWTEHGLWQFLWSEISTACVLAGRNEPSLLCETMWHYLQFLDRTVGLAAGSDSIEVLHGFLQEYGDLNNNGRSRTPVHPSEMVAGQFQLDLESAA